ncbi:MAG: DUF2802 domain-containing protein [Xanthomonadaceae bacterium]|nr:DUF2802 domain-containing protein [Xanthomonadaceae bacterium]
MQHYAFHIAVLLALLAGALAGFALWRLGALRRRLDELESALTVSEQHYQGLSSSSLSQGRRLLQLEQDLARLRARLEEVASSGDVSDSVFNQAIRMARRGCSAQEIMETCGIGQIEADLVVLMHQKGQAK